MNEQLPNDSGNRFPGVSTAELIRRMERSEDFMYDDESMELSRRLASENKTWSWSDDFYRPRIEVYNKAVVLGYNAEDWHQQLVPTRREGYLETPGSRYGTNADQCAWWAVAALSVYEHGGGEPDEAGLFLEYAMSCITNDDEDIGRFLQNNVTVIPKELRRRLGLTETNE